MCVKQSASSRRRPPKSESLSRTYTAIKNVVEGKDNPHAQTFGLANDGVGFAPGNVALPADITAKVTDIQNQIKAGTITVPDTIKS